MDQNEINAQSAREKAEAINRRKRKIIKGVLIFSAVVVALSVIFSFIDPERLAASMFDEGDPDKDRVEEIYFYPVNEDEDIFLNETYMELDHRLFIHEASTGSTYSIEKEDLATAEEDVIFFYNYFETVIRGDNRLYREFFSSRYLASEELPVDFTPQMIYDICVTPMTFSDGSRAYMVEYMIYRNNGTFRADMGSDAILPLLFTLNREGESLKIDSIQKYTSYDRK